jgi:hypothetical protein
MLHIYKLFRVTCFLNLQIEGVRLRVLMLVAMKLSVNVPLKTPWPESASEVYRLSDRRLSVKVVPNLAAGLCNVVATFLSSTSSIVLTRLSGSCSRPTTSQNVW